MNAQQLEYIRIQLRSALMDDSGGTKGQLQAFAEHPPADKNRNPRKPIHLVEIDNGDGGTRLVKADNTALYVLETRSRRRPLPPINDHAFATAPWRRAVNMLPEHEQAWLRYCYGFDLGFSHQTRICQHIWTSYNASVAGGRIQERVKKRLCSLVWLAVQDIAVANSNEIYREQAATALAGLLSIHRDTWYETYSKPWQQFKTLLTSLDKEALERAARQVQGEVKTDDIAKPDTLCHIGGQF